MTEQWRPILGYERFYEVSNQGRIRSMLNNRPRILAGAMDSHGYLTVKLSRNSQQTRHKVHRLVCSAFNGPAPDPAMDCGHLDGSRTNNIPHNLSWLSRAENMSHKALHGTRQNCERGLGAKLSRSQVDEIRNKKATFGLGSRVLSRQYGVSQSQIKRILNGQHWHEGPVSEADAPHPQSPSLSEVEEAPTPDPVRKAKALLEKTLRPFAACVFNDNGDVTVNTGNLTVHHWLALDVAAKSLATLTASQEQDSEVRDA